MSLLQSSRLRSLALVLLCSVAYLGQELILEHYGLHSYALRSQVPRWIYQVLKCDERHLGIIVIIFASLTFGFLSPKGRDWWQDIASIKTSPDRQPNRSLTRYSLLPTGLALLLSISCTVASQHHYLDSGDTFNTRVLWLCGIGLFVVALTFCFTRENRPEHWHTSPTFKCANWVTLVCIVIAAFLLRFWDVGELPKKVNYDVAGVGLFARRNLSESDWRVFGLGDYGVAQLNFAVYSLSMKMFGDNLFGLKMACVIFGTLMVPATYFAAWRSFDCHRIATAAAAFLATNIPSIHFSRHIMNIDPWGVFAGCLFFLAHGMRVYAAWALGAAGLLVAFALHLYLSGRVLCFVIPLFFVLILRHRERWKASLWFGILLFIIGSFVFFGPNVVDIWVNTEAWKGSNRPYSTFLLIRNFYDYARSNHIQTIPEFISSRLWTVLLLIYSRDTSGQTPLGFSFFFNLAITPLFWLGLGVSLFEAKRNPIQLLMSILLLLTMGLGIAIAPVGTYWPKVLCLTLIGAIFIARSGV